MSNTLLLKTDESVNTRSKVFPKLGKCNVAIYRRTNGADEVEIWTWGASHTENPITVNGGKFVAWAANVPNRLVVPNNPLVIDSTELTLPNSTLCYFKVKIDEGLKSCQLMFNNYLSDTSLCGGNNPNQMKIDYSRRPYTINSTGGMFASQLVAYDLSDWDMSDVVFAAAMFENSPNFNQPIGNWNTRSLVIASGIFSGATAFNQPIEGLDLSKCTELRSFMLRARAFNQPVAALNVSVCTDLAQFFEGASAFNQPVEAWNVSACLDMWRMFAYATAFDQPLAAWCSKFNVEVSLNSFMEGKAYRTSYYDDFLNALWLDVNTTRRSQWESRIKPKLLGMGLSKYSSASASARASLVSAGWTIADGGQA